jgi:hypothetical protein
LKSPASAQTLSETMTSDSLSKRGIWEISSLGASLPRLCHVYWEGRLEPGTDCFSLKLISNKIQSLESHQSEEQGACGIPGVALGSSGKNQRPEAKSVLQLPVPRGCQVAPIMALYGQNCPTEPGFGVSALYFRAQGYCWSLPSALIGLSTSQACQDP